MVAHGTKVADMFDGFDGFDGDAIYDGFAGAPPDANDAAYRQLSW